MQAIGLVVALHNTQPPGTSGTEIRRAFERAYLPMLDLLQEFPVVRVSMHWSGPLLEWMELHAPTHLAALIQLVDAGRVEPLGGPYGGGLLPALPERDAVGQVQAMTRWWKARTDVRVRGAWLPWSAWDGNTARVLGRLGMQFSVLDETQFHPPVKADGYYLTEREGTALALFPADLRLARMVPDEAPGKILKYLALRAKDGARCLTLALPGEGFGAGLDTSATRCFGGDRGWVRRFFAALTDNAHWLKLVSFGTALDRMRPTDRAYPPPSVSLPVSVAALGEQGAVYAEILADLRRGDVAGLDRVAPFLWGAAWDQLLTRHPEIDRLHKRMLAASAEVARLRRIVQEERPAEGDPRVDALEEATRALYRAQSGAAYVLGGEVGAQDPGVRHEAYAALCRAEFAVATALGESDRTRVEQADVDCDGRAEIVVRTPQVCAIVAPASGGTLTELDVWSLPGNLLNVRTRRPEPEHAEVRRTENLPRILEAVGASVEIDRGEEEEVTEAVTDLTRLASLRAAEDGLAGRLHYDRHVRAGFVDHFLGPEANLQNVRIGRFPEAGDFVGADYTLLHLEEPEAGPIVVGMARDGNVNEGAALRLVRVLKRFAFSRDLPVIDVRYEIANRYHEPVRSRFAVELNLGLDGLGDEVVLQTADGTRWDPRTPTEHAEIAQISMVDNLRGWRATWFFSQPAHLWHYPVETVGRTPRGLAAVPQGVCLLAWWPVELWGLERRRLDLTLALEC